jgi:hypothetical protein
MDEKNHHLHKAVFIGEGEGPTASSTSSGRPRGQVKAQPWSPFIAGNEKKVDEPALMATKKVIASDVVKRKGRLRRPFPYAHRLFPVDAGACAAVPRARCGGGRQARVRRRRRALGALAVLVAEGDPKMVALLEALAAGDVQIRGRARADRQGRRGRPMR